MKRSNAWHLFTINAYWIGLSFMWNSLHVTIIPAVLLKYVPEAQKNTWLGLLTFFGLILALLIFGLPRLNRRLPRNLRPPPP